MMVSINNLMFVISIFQCGIVILRGSSTDDLPIPVSELIVELRQKPPGVSTQQLFYMFWIESFGDHLYYLDKNPSMECATITRAFLLMFEKLALTEYVHSATNDALNVAVDNLSNETYQETHPVELVCQITAKIFTENTTLSVPFERAKIEVTKLPSVSGGPPYFPKILKANTVPELFAEMGNKLYTPKSAKFMAVRWFLTVSVTQTPAVSSSPCRYFLAKACLAVAKEEAFADSMQSVFSKVMDNTAADIIVEGGLENWRSSSPSNTTIRIDRSVPKMMRTLYGSIASDGILKKEVERMAAIIGQNEEAKPEDLDFSKL